MRRAHAEDEAARAQVCQYSPCAQCKYYTRAHIYICIRTPRRGCRTRVNEGRARARQINGRHGARANANREVARELNKSGDFFLRARRMSRIF